MNKHCSNCQVSLLEVNSRNLSGVEDICWKCDLDLCLGKKHLSQRENDTKIITIPSEFSKIFFYDAKELRSGNMESAMKTTWGAQSKMKKMSLNREMPSYNYDTIDNVQGLLVELDQDDVSARLPDIFYFLLCINKEISPSQIAAGAISWDKDTLYVEIESS